MAEAPLCPAPIGAVEDAVLQYLWQADGESSVAAAHAAIGEPRGISLNTVGSALERLHRKHLVTRHKVSHAYQYRPVMDRASFRAWRAAEAAGGVRALADEGVLAAFVELVAQTDPHALERLASLVARRRNEPEP